MIKHTLMLPKQFTCRTNVIQLQACLVNRKVCLLQPGQDQYDFYDLPKVKSIIQKDEREKLERQYNNKPPPDKKDEEKYDQLLAGATLFSCKIFQLPKRNTTLRTKSALDQY